MSDLLGRLISRAKSDSSPVEPILSSRYEVPAPLDLPLAAPRGGETRANHSTDRREDRGGPEEEFSEARPRVDVSREELRLTNAEEDEVSNDSKRAVHQEAAEQPARPVQTRPLASRVDPVERSPVHPTLESQEHVQTGAEQIEIRTFTELMAVPEKPVVPRENLSISVKRAEQRPEQQSVPSISSSSSRPEDAAKQVEPQSIEVHVSIGHIEVRAAAPAQAPPPRIARPRASVSLDDYLKRRNGGSR